MSASAYTSGTTEQSEPSTPARAMVAILDYGSQYSRLIARRVRECHVYCELLPATITLDELRRMGARGVILSGGPDSVYDPGARTVDPAILESDLPILGICYGMQLFAHQMGGRVEMHTGRREYGPAEIHLTTDERAMGDGGERDPATLFAGIEMSGAGTPVWMSHGDSVGDLPPGFEVIARSNSGALAAMGDARGHIGIQFHPEVTHTPQGAQIIENFLFRISGLTPNWTTGAFIEETVARIRAAGRRGGPRDLRPLRRGGFRRRRAAGPQGDWRPPDLHLRRYGLHARGRAGAGRRDLPRQPPHPAGRGGRQRALPEPAGRRDRPGAQAQDHRRGVRPRLRGRGRAPA